jgi:endonuclease/exonuclease/phosphatase (EEP) superfamily protein YafD
MVDLTGIISAPGAAPDPAVSRLPELRVAPSSLRLQGNIGVKIVSWNVLRLTGAAVEDVAALVRREQPALLLMQEATQEMAELPDLVGGHFYWEPLPERIHGLAAWSPHEIAPPEALPLPQSRMPGRVPRRVAQLVRLDRITVANVHLSHGQWLNRWQLLHVVRALEGPAAVIGDYNAVGPTMLPGFRDVGPREPTHRARNVLPFRLDRCLARGLYCAEARALDQGPSDHRPIVLELAAFPAEVVSIDVAKRRRRAEVTHRTMRG